MFEMFVEFDLLMYGTATAYYEGKNYQECKELVERDLHTWGGGHADMFNADGEFIDDVEV